MVLFHFLLLFLLGLPHICRRHARAPGILPESEPCDRHLPEQDRFIVEAEPDPKDPCGAFPEEELRHTHQHRHERHADEERRREDAVHERDVDQIVNHDDRRRDRDDQPEVEGERHERLFLPHIARSDEGFAQPRTLPAHLLFQENLVTFGDDGLTDRRILIGRAVMTQDEIRQTAIITKGRLAPQKLLMNPRITIFFDQILPIAGKRPREAGRRIEEAFRRLHDAEGDIVAHRLHLGERIRIGIRDIRPPADTAHLLILERLHDISDRKGREEGVRVDKDQKLMLCQCQPARKSFSLAAILRLHEAGEPVTNVRRRVILVELSDEFFHFLHGTVRRAVIHHDDLQLIRRIVLIHTGKHRPLDPCLFIETRDNDRDTRREMDIHRNRFIEDGEEIARKQKSCRNNAI